MGIYPPGGVLYGCSHQACGRGQPDRFSAVLRIVTEPVLKICRHRQHRRLGDGACVTQGLVAADCASAIGAAQRESEPGTGRRQRLVAQLLQHLGGPDIPRIGNDERV